MNDTKNKILLSVAILGACFGAVVTGISLFAQSISSKPDLVIISNLLFIVSGIVSLIFGVLFCILRNRNNILPIILQLVALAAIVINASVFRALNYTIGGYEAIIAFFIFIIAVFIVGLVMPCNTKPNPITNDWVQFMSRLSKREQEIITAVFDGNTSYKDIAGRLNISVNTVKFHLKNIYKITDVSNLKALLALLHGLNKNSQTTAPYLP